MAVPAGLCCGEDASRARETDMKPGSCAAEWAATGAAPGRPAGAAAAGQRVSKRVGRPAAPGHELP